jgi:hypothetical protein
MRISHAARGPAPFIQSSSHSSAMPVPFDPTAQEREG